MPQFDFATVFWPQLIWLAIIFSVLFFAIVLPTLPKLGKVIDAREDKVRGDVTAAETAKSAADTLQVENASETSKAQEAARAALAEAKAKAAHAVEQKLAAANAKIAQHQAMEQGKLDNVRDVALKSVAATAHETAADIIQKLSGVRPSSDALALNANMPAGNQS